MNILIRNRQMLIITGYILLCLSIKLANAGEVTVAVASNFLQPMRELANQYQAETGHLVKISSGSTGKLYAQISHGAPYDVFFAANVSEPERLESSGLAVSGSRFTYAVGQLIIWSKTLELENEFTLKELIANRKIRTLTLANPKTAPYGFAATEILKNLNISLTGIRVLKGENINQAWQYTQTGNADIGFIAASQWEAGTARARKGLAYKPSAHLYSEIEQQAVVLSSARNSETANDFVRFIQRDDIRKKISDFGYANMKVASAEKRL